MLYLSQVQKNELSGKVGLRLLVSQEAEYTWTLLADEVVISVEEAIALNEGLLVLVKLSPTGEIERLEHATNWVMELVKTYLANGITPAFVHQETERAEQWRQSLTLQTQELSRRSLELEARREQIQALEEELEARREQIQALEKELEARREQIQALPESFKQEKDGENHEGQGDFKF